MLIVMMIAGAVLAVMFLDRLEFSFLGAFLGFVLWRMNQLSAELKQLRVKLKEITHNLMSFQTEQTSSRPSPKAIHEDSLQIPMPQHSQKKAVTETILELFSQSLKK